MTRSTTLFISYSAIILLCLTALTACDPATYGTGSNRTTTKSPTVTAADYARQGNHTAAARAYRKLANESTGIQRDKYFLEAAQQWFEVERYQNAQRELASIRTLLDGESQVRKILLQTRVLLELGQPQQALVSIDTLNPQNSANIARPYYGLKAHALFELGKITAGTKHYLMRERFLRNRSEIENNRQRLWKALNSKMIQGYREEYDANDKLLAGWISLAESLSTASSSRAEKQIISAWSQDYPNHPALDVALMNLTATDDQFVGVSSLGSIRNIGVLLPLTGRLAKAGSIIRQGIEAANRRQTIPYKLSFHDTDLGALNAFSEARNYKVDAMIGPLSKENILELSGRLGATPVLALNRIDDLGFNSLIQFGLAPEDEAIASAKFALAQGYTQALTLSPSNEWGDRVLQSFLQAFTEGGGTIMEQATYSTRDNDHSSSITNLLNVDESKQRFQQVRALLGNEIEYEARRRNDTDLIFLAAQANQGRLIRPQLKFHFASRIPVFATSSIFEADPVRNKDIDGIQIPLSDWIMDPLSRDAILASDLNISEDNPASSQILALYSLGFDALSYLGHLSIDTLTPYSGLSGELSLDEFGVVHRSLPLGLVQGGRIEKIEDISAIQEYLESEAISESEIDSDPEL